MSRESPESEFKSSMAGVFDRATATYDRVGSRQFTHFGRGPVRIAGIQRGSEVLDVACGGGAVLLAAGDEIGPSGYVDGIDRSPGMVMRLMHDLARKASVSRAVSVLGG